jgi:hypothetical protein
MLQQPAVFNVILRVWSSVDGLYYKTVKTINSKRSSCYFHVTHWFSWDSMD